jgi:hypothetical protein
MRHKLFLVGLISFFLCGCEGPEYRTLVQQRQYVFAKYPEWSEKVRENIRQKRLVKGMTKEQVELAWDCSLSLDYVSSSGLAVYRAEYVYFHDDLDEMNGSWRAFMKGMRSNMTSDCLFYFDDGLLTSWSCSPRHGSRY